MKKTIIEIGRGIKCIYLPREAQKKVEQDLAFENPAYKKALEQGRSPGNLSPYIVLYDKEKDTYWLPRGYIYWLIKFMKRINHPYLIIDETLKFNPLNLQFKGKLRDYQQLAEKEILKYPVGILEASTGAGKTTIALSVMTQRQQPTLILVHTKELLYQWKDRIKEFLQEDCGLIGDGKFQIKPITVGTIQTVHKKLPEITKHFGHLVIDECFVKGTLIDSKPIETLKVGDYVNSFNHKTKKVEKKKILTLFKNKAPSVLVSVCTPNKTITGTVAHPYFCPLRNYYVEATKLFSSVLNDKLQKVDITDLIIQKNLKEEFVYNIEVEDNNNYFAEGILVHNCHRYGSHTTAYTIQDFPARYFLGLTATPFRSDGLTKIIFAGVGPKIHKVNKTGLFKSGAVLQPKIIKVDTDFKYIFTNDYSAMISALTKDEKRNQLICNKIAENLKMYNESILVISDRKTHAEMIQKTLLNRYKINSSLLIGTTNKKIREKSVQDIKEGKSKVLIATTSLIMEGFDCPALTSLFITTPIKFSGRLIQAVGRILRPSKEGKTKIPLIYDFRDDWVPVLRFSGYSRDRSYKTEWK